MPTSLEPDFLTPEYFEIYRKITEAAESLGIGLWLYDEGGWPSGSANGRVVQNNPLLARQCLVKKEEPHQRGDKIRLPDNVPAAWIYQEGEKPRRIQRGETVVIQKDHAALTMFSAQRAELDTSAWTYPDLLNPESTRSFLQFVHEAYRKIIGKYLGNTIRIAFTDEPGVPRSSAGSIPWTDDLPEDFLRKKGYDLTLHLPDLFGEFDKERTPEEQKVRIDFYDWWTGRFAEAYLGQIQDWCRRNNLLSAGHFGGENETLGAVRHGYGHILRAMRRLDIPGVDAIWRQIFPKTGDIVFDSVWGKFVVNQANHHFPKFASSVAHQKGSPWALTESFCVYGSGLTVEQMKWVTDYQYVRGLNLIVIGNYPQSTREHLMGGQRPQFGPINPLWKYMAGYHDYTARLGYLLSLGRPMIRSALYYPVRDLWAGGPEMKTVAEANDRLARCLLENQCDFDFIDDDVFEDAATKVNGPTLAVGPMQYDTVYISKSRWMSLASRAKLDEFAAQGGKVQWVGDESSVAVIPLVKVEPACPCLRVSGRCLENGSLYVITNESTVENMVRVTARFQESAPAYQLDLETGASRQLEAVARDGASFLHLDFEFAESKVILFTHEPLAAEKMPAQHKQELLNLEQGWNCRRIISYRIGEHDITVEEINEESFSPVALGDWRGVLGEDFSGDAEYLLSLQLDDQLIKERLWLDLGRVGHAAEVCVNGKTAGKKAWRPFVFPLTGLLKPGTNELRIIVTNTMANQFVTSKVLDKWPENVVGPYHRISRTFEPDSIPSGLFGPVKIFREI